MFLNILICLNHSLHLCQYKVKVTVNMNITRNLSSQSLHKYAHHSERSNFKLVARRQNFAPWLSFSSLLYFFFFFLKKMDHQVKSCK
jgi:hypothetical protein